MAISWVERVYATNSLWFAWSDLDFIGPEGEIGSGYRPVAIDCTGIARLRLDANPDHKWSHHPGVFSDANGISDTRVSKAKYKHANFKSNKILQFSNRLNLLVGMFGGDTEPAPGDPDVQQFSIGLSSEFDVQDDYLYLGFHDGRHWTNNQGFIDVTVTIVARLTAAGEVVEVEEDQ